MQGKGLSPARMSHWWARRQTDRPIGPVCQPRPCGPCSPWTIPSAAPTWVLAGKPFVYFVVPIW